MAPILNRHHRRSRQRRVAAITAVLAETLAVYAATKLYRPMPLPPRRPYHTSKLTGHAWVQEVLLGNPHRVKDNFGLSKRGFRRLVTALEQKTGLSTSRRGITTNEQVAMFLYTVTTGLTLRKVAERFQHSLATVSKSVHPKQSTK